MQTLLFVSWMAINPIVGDASWIEAHGEAPHDVPEVERIRTHLLYAEARLRAAPAPDVRTKAERARMLDALHAYAESGVFPQHDGPIAGRAPRFIDHEGRLCAVGHLVAISEGLPAAERINAAHEYERILDMHEPEVEAWARAHGFTMMELGVIQPSYAEPSFRTYESYERRGFTGSLRALMPILPSDVETANGARLAYEPVGGGGEAAFGYELGAVALLLAGGATGHDARADGALAMIRASLGALWTIEAGCQWVAPQLGIAAGLLMLSAESGFGASAFGSLSAGARFRFTRWLALDATLAFEGATPGAVLTSALGWITPSLSLSIGGDIGGHWRPDMA